MIRFDQKMSQKMHKDLNFAFPYFSILCSFQKIKGDNLPYFCQIKVAT